MSDDSNPPDSPPPTFIAPVSLTINISDPPTPVVAQVGDVTATGTDADAALTALAAAAPADVSPPAQGSGS